MNRVFFHLWAYLRFAVAGAIATVFVQGLQVIFGLHVGLTWSLVVQLEEGYVIIAIIGSIIHYGLSYWWRVLKRP